MTRFPTPRWFFRAVTGVVAMMVGLAAWQAWIALCETDVEQRLAVSTTPTPARVLARPLNLEIGADASGLDPRVVPGHRLEPTSDDALAVHTDENGTVTQLLLGGEPVEAVRIRGAEVMTLRGVDGPKRRPERLADLPDHLVKAVLAIEDHRFMDHNGIDLIGLSRAAVANVSAGRIVQGGSTITQQWVKNEWLGPARTFDRKIREIGLAVALEAKVDKDEILRRYLNGVYLGQLRGAPIHGVGAAAHALFDQPAATLDLAQSALIAGMIQAPNAFDPFDHPERSFERRNVVLRAMAARHFIDVETAELAASQPLALERPKYVGRVAPFFEAHLRETLGAELGERAIVEGGLVVESTLDPRLQAAAEEVVREHVKRLRDSLDVDVEGALVALDPRTGDIVAMVGGHDFGTSQFNRATQARRQIGSLVKPFVVAAALNETGHRLGPSTLLPDRYESSSDAHAAWSPSDYDGREDGWVTLRRTIERSENLPVLALAKHTGLDDVQRTLARFGLGRGAHRWPSLALGAMDASPLEVAAAYGAIANGGVYIQPRAYRAVRESDGSTVLLGDETRRRVAAPDEAYLIDDLLRGVMKRGTGASARRLGYEYAAAGKTGTSDDARDAWFVGYDADLVVAVWIGADQPTPMDRTGGEIALPVWVDFMKRARTLAPPERRALPPTLTAVDVCAVTHKRATWNCTHKRRELFWASHDGVEACPAHPELDERGYVAAAEWSTPTFTTL